MLYDATLGMYDHQSALIAKTRWLLSDTLLWQLEFKLGQFHILFLILYPARMTVAITSATISERQNTCVLLYYYIYIDTSSLSQDCVGS